MLFGLKQGTAKTELLKPALDENSTLSNRNTTTSSLKAGMSGGRFPRTARSPVT